MKIKILMIAITCFPIHLSGMQLDEQVTALIEKFKDMELDTKAVDEFIHNKKEIRKVCEAQGVTIPDSNLLAAYSWFADSEASEVILELNKESIKSKLAQLEDVVINHPEYKEALAQARKVNTEEAWRAWRFKSGADIVKPILIKNGFIITEPKAKTLAHITANKDISEETACWIMAHSVLLYKNRQLQRQLTGKDLPPIPIS